MPNDSRLIDHLIEKLAAKTGSSYHKRPDSDYPDSQDCFEWNVMHAFVALAAIVHPVKKDDDLIEVCRTKKNRTENVIP